MVKSGLFSQAGWSLTAQIGYYGLQWLNMIFLARLSGPEAVGLYTLGLAIANPIMAIASLMLRMVYITDQEGRWSFQTYKRLRRISLPFGALIVVCTGFILGYRDMTLTIILLAASWKVAENLSDINYAIPHKRGDMEPIALSMIGRAALSTIILAFTLEYTGRLDFALLGFSLTWWLYFCIRDKQFEKQAEPQKSKGNSTSLFKFAFPMALSAATIYLTFSVPRIVLDQFEDTATLGIFAAISHLLLIGTMLVNSLGSALTPRLSRHFANHDFKNYYKEITFGAAAALFTSTGFILVAFVGGDLLLTLLYGSQIGMEKDLIIAISLTSLPIYLGSLLGFIPPALQAYKFHLTVNIITVVGTALAAFTFIPVFGVKGAIYAILIQGLLQLLNGLILFKKPAP